ncbi:MAG TPA: acyl-CoA-binding protein [Flavobacterium sp.]|jgi:acyl-CoA-binding protein|nr:acyl-CoA-binding protein [Flavobacterium sp.]
MSEKDLDTRFKEAFEIASNMEQDSLPQDIMLRLYAFYKQAAFGNIGSINYSAHDVIDAFKLNAWLQVSHLSEDEAKQAYIDLINEITQKR